MDAPTLAMPRPTKQKRAKRKKREERHRAAARMSSPIRPISAAFLGVGLLFGVGLGWFLSARPN